MQLKYTALLALSLFSPLALNSCDGTDTIAANSIVNRLNEVAESLSESENNDRIDFTSLTGVAGFRIPNNIIFSGNTGTENKSDTGQTYEYVKTGASLFNLVSTSDSAENLSRSLGVTLGAPSPLGTRLRELLLRATANFTAAEIVEILNILNSSGASLFVDANNPLQILSNDRITIRHRITSNNRDLLAGTARGPYRVDVRALQVGFRAPTRQELSDFRLLTVDHKIPFITSTASTEENINSGIWVMSIANRENRVQ